MSRGAITFPAPVNGRSHAACEVRWLALSSAAAPADGDGYLLDSLPRVTGAESAAIECRALDQAGGIVLASEGARRATTLLDAGARRVLLGEAALDDKDLIAKLAARFGSERVGVYVPARRLEVSWSFDTSSNADFKVLTPSLGAPAWEVLRADGTRTGIQALWWIGEMLNAGAGEALLRVDIEDDADLNLCADCVDRFGARVWIGPLEASAPPLPDWARYGHAARFALPPHLYADVREAGVAVERAMNAASRAA